jgi:hypothetical protein
MIWSPRWSSRRARDPGRLPDQCAAGDLADVPVGHLPPGPPPLTAPTTSAFNGPRAPTTPTTSSASTATSPRRTRRPRGCRWRWPEAGHRGRLARPLRRPEASRRPEQPTPDLAVADGVRRRLFTGFGVDGGSRLPQQLRVMTWWRISCPPRGRRVEDAAERHGPESGIRHMVPPAGSPELERLETVRVGPRASHRPQGLGKVPECLVHGLVMPSRGRMGVVWRA